MGERSERVRVGDRPRTAVEREWEVFVREATGEPLRHVGSVTAPTGEVAHEQATTLFGWAATDVWLCPADAVARYSTRALDDGAEPVRPDTGDGERSHEA